MFRWDIWMLGHLKKRLKKSKKIQCQMSRFCRDIWKKKVEKKIKTFFFQKMPKSIPIKVRPRQQKNKRKKKNNWRNKNIWKTKNVLQKFSKSHFFSSNIFQVSLFFSPPLCFLWHFLWHFYPPLCNRKTDRNWETDRAMEKQKAAYIELLCRS